MLPFHECKVTTPPDYFCKMKTKNDRFLNSNNPKLDDDKDDEVIITMEVPSRINQTIVIASDSESDDSDIAVLPADKFKIKSASRLTTDAMSESVVNIDSDDDIFVFDDGMKSIFDATSVVVKGNDPFLSANIGVGEDDCKVRLFDIDFSYQSSNTKKSESMEATPVGMATDILDIHAPLPKPVFLTSNTIPENESSSSDDVLFNDSFPKTSHPTYPMSHMTPPDGEDATFKSSASTRDSSTSGRIRRKLSKNCPNKKSSKDLSTKKSSNPHTNSSTWSIVSTEQNKVILRRSPRPAKSVASIVGENYKKRSANSPQISLKKKIRQLELQPASKQPGSTGGQDAKVWPNNKSGDCGALQSLPAFVNPNLLEEQSMCYGCKSNFGVSQLSYCMAGHGCCGQCIQIQVKSLLAKGRKGVLKCRYVACNSFYLVSQLRNSLPPMVVEILEEKLDREYCDNAAKLMLQASGRCGVACNSKDCVASKDGGHVCHASVTSDDDEDEDHQKQDPNFYPNLPRTWEPMPKSEEFRLVDLCKGSEEYNFVAAQFHQTMTRPRASIVKIKHLQNPILWQFYNVKKTQMERDNPQLINEKHLFHGTSKKAVEAICRTNFDWRLCGSHGTTYGQGSYFARDAAYSHMYTDQPVPSPHSRHLQAPLQNNLLFNASQNSQISQQPHHHIPTHPHHVGQTTAGQLAQQIIFQTFPGTSHSVSIAALQSCRFARIPLGPPGGPQQVIIPPAAVPPTAISFGPYWSLNGGSSTGSQLQQLSRPNGIISLHQPPSSVNKQLHPPGQHHHHNHHLPAPHLGHHGQQHIPHQPVNLTMSQQDHIHIMFLARVLVGEYEIGKNSYRKPPSKDSTDPYGKCFDACVNDTNNPTIYVIFNSSQCYPEYVIEYTNKPRDM